MKKSWREALLLLLILVLGFLLRMAFLHEPFERDEGLYGYIGQEILRGSIPYRDIADLKPPGIFYIYAAIIAFFGNTTEAVRVATGIYALFTIVSVFLLARYLYGSKAGLSAAFLFALFSPSPLLQGSSSNTEIFMLLPLVMSGYLLLRGVDSGGRGCFAASGFAAGAALAIKTVALPFVLLMAAFIVFRPGLTGEWKGRSLDAVCFFVPIIAMGLATLGYFAYHGALADMYYWNVTIHKTYVNRDGSEFFTKMLAAFRFLFQEQLLLWVAGISGGLYLFYTRRDGKSLFILLLLGVSFVSVSMPGHFFHHYFILLTPFFAVAGGGGIGTLLENRGIPFYLMLSGIVIGLACHVKADYNCYFMYTPEQVSTYKYDRPTFAQSVGIAEYVKARTLPEDYIIQWGFEQEIYFLTNRRGLPNLHSFLMVEWAPDREKALRAMLEGVNTKKPKYILLQNEDNFYVTRAFGFRELGELIQRDYYPEHEQGWAVFYRRKAGI